MFADPLSSPTDRISTIRYMFLPTVAFGFEYTNTSGPAYPTLFPIPLTYKVSHGKPDPSTWKTYDFEHCGQGPFESAEELMAAYEVGDVEICDLGLTDDYDALWAGLKRRGPMRKRSNRAVPVISSPDGPRFTLSGRSVEWMGWSFHVDLHPRYGPIFSDIKFKGERIFYEMSLQETYTAYSGYSGHGEVLI
jgi:Copper amine oxidase, enzyme domain